MFAGSLKTGVSRRWLMLCICRVATVSTGFLDVGSHPYQTPANSITGSWQFQRCCSLPWDVSRCSNTCTSLPIPTNGARRLSACQHAQPATRRLRRGRSFTKHSSPVKGYASRLLIRPRRCSIKLLLRNPFPQTMITAHKNSSKLYPSVSQLIR